MSNTDSIIAICRDDVYSAVSYDASTWNVRELDTSHAWRFIGGNVGHFAYDEQNLATIHTCVCYTITDYTQWHGGVLPNASIDTIVATFDTSNVLYTSFNGTSFTAPNQTFYVECIAVACTDQTDDAPGTSFSQTNTHVPTTYPITCSAISWTYSVWAQVRIKILHAIATPVTASGRGLMYNSNNGPESGEMC